MVPKKVYVVLLESKTRTKRNHINFFLPFWGTVHGLENQGKKFIWFRKPKERQNLVRWVGSVTKGGSHASGPPGLVIQPTPRLFIPVPPASFFNEDARFTYITVRLPKVYIQHGVHFTVEVDQGVWCVPLTPSYGITTLTQINPASISQPFVL